MNKPPEEYPLLVAQEGAVKRSALAAEPDNRAWTRSHL